MAKNKLLNLAYNRKWALAASLTLATLGFLRPCYAEGEGSTPGVTPDVSTPVIAQPMVDPSAASVSVAQTTIDPSVNQTTQAQPPSQSSVPVPETSPAAAAQAAQAAVQQNLGVLDLSSTIASITASQLGQIDPSLGSLTAPITIQNGAQSQLVDQNTVLTPAQALAVYQVMTNQTQTINLGADGSAISGHFNLTSGLESAFSGLIVPTGVTTLYNSSSNPTLDFSGTFANSGNFYSYSTATGSASEASAAINAGSILNNSTGLISSVLPSSVLSLASITDYIQSMNLSLTSLGNLTNLGVISSSGNLAFNAGGSFINHNSISSAGDLAINATSAINNYGAMAAANNIAMTSAIGSINNSGTIAATMGNINIASMAATTNIAGGNWYSNEFNLHAPGSIIDINVSELTGILNIDAECAHVTASTSDLNLGLLNITGDPVYYNTGGSITTGAITTAAGQDLTLAASGNVTVNGALNTSPGAPGTGNLHIIAGANFVPPPPIIDSQVNNSTSQVLTISQSALPTGGSATGGNITVNGAINTGGGNLNMIAFAGTGGINGNINTQASINTGNAGAGSNGNIVSIAGGSAGTGFFNNGTVSTTNGGTGTAGNILIASATPVINGGTATINAAGSLIGSFSAGTATGAGLNFSSTSLNAGGGNISVLSASGFNQLVTTGANNLTVTSTGGNVNLPGQTVTGYLNVNVAGNLDLQGPMVAQNMSLLSGYDNAIATVIGGNMTVRANLTAPGGMTLISAGNINAFNAGTILSTDSAVGNAGNMLLVAGANYTNNLSTGVVTITGRSGINPSSISISSTGANAVAITARATGAGTANGGNITMVSFTDGAGSGGVYAGSNNIIQTGGINGGTNGNFLAVSDNNFSPTGTVINTGPINTTGGLSGTGNVTLLGANPLAAGASVTVTKSNATITSGNFTSGALVSNMIVPTQITSDNASIVIRTDGDVRPGSGALTPGITGFSNLDIRAGTQVDIFGSITGRNISILSGANIASAVVNGGNLNIRESITAQNGGGILLAASGTVSMPNAFAGNVIRSDSTTSKAGDITIVAGANYTENTAAGTITVTGNSNVSNSGNVSIGGPAALTPVITARGGGAGNAGGNISIVSFVNPLGGGISLGTGSITQTSGTGAANGNIVVVSNNTISSTGSLDTSGGTNGTGNITVLGANPLATGSTVTISKNTGAVTAGNFTSGSLTSTQLTPQATTSSGGNVTFRTLGNIFPGQGSPAPGFAGFNNLDISAGLNIDIFGPMTGRNISILAGADNTQAQISGGNLNIRNSLIAQNGGGILLVAGGNISNPEVHLGRRISTEVTSGTAGNITMVAGANFTENVGAGTVTVLGNSNINGVGNFNTSDPAAMTAVISARGIGAGTTGGTVNIAAFANPGGGGVVGIGRNVILGTGGTGGANGNINIVGAGNVSLGTLDTSGGTTGTGNIAVLGANPLATGATATISKSTSTLSAGNFTSGSLTTAQMTPSAVTSSGGDLVMRTDGDLFPGFGGPAPGITGVDNAIIRAGSNIDVFGDISANTVEILSGANLPQAVISGGTMNLRGNIAGPGGIMLASAANIQVPNATTISSNNATGNAGNISLISGAAYTENTSTGAITVTGAAGLPGGNGIFLQTGTGANKLSAQSTAPNGAGGNISLISQGQIRIATSDNIQAGGNGSGANGTVNVIGPGFMELGSINTTGGQTSTGNVNIQGATPTNGYTAAANGTISGTFLNPGGVTNNGIQTRSITTSGGGVAIYEGDTGTLLTTGNINTSGANGTGSGAAQAGGGGPVFIQAGTVRVLGDITANGGLGTDGNVLGGTGGAGGAGGTISLHSLDPNAPTGIQVGNMSAMGGLGGVGANGAGAANGNTGGAGGTGGNIQIFAMTSLSSGNYNTSGGTGGAGGNSVAGQGGNGGVGGTAGTSSNAGADNRGLSVVAGNTLSTGSLNATGGAGGAAGAGATTGEQGNGGSGGTVILHADTDTGTLRGEQSVLQINGTINANGGLGTIAGNGSPLILAHTCDSPNPLQISGGGSNYIAGQVLANGFNGGNVQLINGGGQNPPGSPNVQVNGMGGTNGTILESSDCSLAPPLPTALAAPPANPPIPSNPIVPVIIPIPISVTPPITGVPISLPILTAPIMTTTDEIIGTRLPTDITPPQDNPPLFLNGAIQVNATTQNAGVVFNANEFTAQHIADFVNQNLGIAPGSGGSVLNLQNGNILLAPTQDITVNTPVGQVAVKAGAVAFLINDGNNIAVLNLHDSQNGDVTVRVNDSILKPNPGQQVVLSSNTDAEFDHVNPASPITYRNLQSQEVAQSDQNTQSQTKGQTPNPNKTSTPLDDFLTALDMTLKKNPGESLEKTREQLDKLAQDTSNLQISLTNMHNFLSQVANSNPDTVFNNDTDVKLTTQRTLARRLPKVANSLSEEADALKAFSDKLAEINNQTDDDITSLKTLAQLIKKGQVENVPGLEAIAERLSNNFNPDELENNIVKMKTQAQLLGQKTGLNKESESMQAVAQRLLETLKKSNALQNVKELKALAKALKESLKSPDKAKLADELTRKLNQLSEANRHLQIGSNTLSSLVSSLPNGNSSKVSNAFALQNITRSLNDKNNLDGISSSLLSMGETSEKFSPEMQSLMSSLNSHNNEIGLQLSSMHSMSQDLYKSGNPVKTMISILDTAEKVANLKDEQKKGASALLNLVLQMQNAPDAKSQKEAALLKDKAQTLVLAAETSSDKLDADLANLKDFSQIQGMPRPNFSDADLVKLTKLVSKVSSNLENYLTPKILALKATAFTLEDQLNKSNLKQNINNLNETAKLAATHQDENSMTKADIQNLRQATSQLLKTQETLSTFSNQVESFDSEVEDVAQKLADKEQFQKDYQSLSDMVKDLTSETASSYGNPQLVKLAQSVKEFSLANSKSSLQNDMASLKQLTMDLVQKSTTTGFFNYATGLEDLASKIDYDPATQKAYWSNIPGMSSRHLFKLAAHKTEFSYYSAFSNIPVLRQMLKSPDPAKRKLAEAILKDAVIKLSLNRNPEPYRSQQPKN